MIQSQEGQGVRPDHFGGEVAAAVECESVVGAPPADLGPVIKALQAADATSLRGNAKALNERGVPTATGEGKWSDVCWEGSQLGHPLSKPPSSMRPIGDHDQEL
jgi:hypothetical protein